MKKTYSIIVSLLITVMGIALFIIKGSLTNLFFGIIGVGILLSEFEEKIISRILMITGALGVAVFGIWSIVSVFSSLL